MKTRWFRVAERNGDYWEHNKDCPFQDAINPLAELRKAVGRGEFLTAQRRVGKHRFELLATVPQKNRGTFNAVETFNPGNFAPQHRHR